MHIYQLTNREKRDSTFFVEYFWVVLLKHKSTGPHSD